MLKIVTTLNNRRTLILALERVNTDRLHQDMPMVIDLQALRQSADYDEPFQDLVIFAEETLEAAHAKLVDLGLPMPGWQEPTPDGVTLHRGSQG